MLSTIKTAWVAMVSASLVHGVAAVLDVVEVVLPTRATSAIL
jgi:hypothetical protein